MISAAGMFAGVTEKFNPFFNKDTSASLRDLDERMITHLVLSTEVVLAGETETCFFARKSFKQLALLMLFGVVKDSLGVSIVS